MFVKKIVSAALSLTVALGAAAFAAADEAAEDEGSAVKVLADWQFNENSVLSGSIEDGNLCLKDLSGNGNSLVMETYGSAYADTVSFSSEGLIEGQGSMFFNGVNDSNRTGVTGVDFITADGSPINSDEFENGYTIEIIYKMPDDWTTADRWENILSRLGYCSTLDSEYDNERITALVSVSNCKEVQFYTANKDDSHSMSHAAWSNAMDKAETWYSIVITGDGHEIRNFINGAASFRDYVSDEMVGIATGGDGRFRIASRVQGTTPYRFTRGYIQEIRISEGALDREDWLLPNPEEYLGEYGNNEDFEKTPDDRYNFVFLPDIQNTVQYMPDVMYTAMNWMVENKDFANISAVLGLGDNVNDFWETEQWDNAVRSAEILTDGGVPLLMMTGNHDVGNNTNDWYYQKYFGAGSDYAKAADYVTIDSPSGFSSYMTVRAGSYEYLLVAVGMYSLDKDEAWLRNVLEENPALPAIIISHDMMECSAAAPNEVSLDAKGEAVWNVVKGYDNVFMMVAGHNHGYGNLTLTNDYGHDVFAVLADYQFSYNGGNAMFKFAEFNEKDGEIHISTFSPYVQSLAAEDKTFFDVNFMTGKGNDDTLHLNFAERFSFAAKEISYGENLIENYGFEESTAGWTYSDNGSIGDVLAGWQRSAEQHHEGSYSLKQIDSGGNGSDKNLAAFIPIESGKKYKLTYWEYSTKDLTGGFNRMHAAVVTTDKGALNNTSIQLPQCGGFSSWVNEASGAAARDPNYYTGWTQRSYVFDTTDSPDAKYILIGYAWGDANTFYLDDFSLTEITESYPVSFGNASVERTEDGVSVWCMINNASHADRLCYVAVGSNESGALVSLAAKTDLSGGTALFLPDADGKITSVKLLCWDAFDTMLPLCEDKILLL